jgi:adenosylmethionine-8-amino-7-oxononanoate aminotransferase
MTTLDTTKKSRINKGKEDGRPFPKDFRERFPLLVRGKGVYVYDEHGNEYLDAAAGLAVVSIGHGRKEVANVLARQAEKLAYCAGNLFENEVAKIYTQRLGKITPGDLNSIYFTSGGSESNEAAMKIARQYFLERGLKSKRLFLGRWLGYHGATLGTLSLSGHKGRRMKYEPLLLPFPHIPPAYCYRCPFDRSYPSCDLACASALEEAIVKAGPKNVAGFFAEPAVAAACGAAVPPKEYFPMISDICKKYDVLFIDDEVITGFGRTGRNFGIDHWEVVPDMMTCAKGMSGGYVPLGAVMISDGIRSVFEESGASFEHVFTFSSNPLALAAGLAVLEIIETEGLVERAATLGKILFEETSRLSEYPIVGDVRGLGLMIGVELVKDKDSKEPYPPEKNVAMAVYRAALEEGVIVYPGTGSVDGNSGDLFYLFPPLTIFEEEIKETIGRTDKAIKKVEETLVASS